MNSNNLTFNSFVALTMVLMMAVIASLATIVYLQSKEERPPIVLKTQVIDGPTRYPKIPLRITDGTYRLRMKAVRITFGIIQATQEGTGSSFGVDLSEYGMPEKRYLLTAAHCVVVEGKPVDSLEIQIRQESGKKKWISCRCLVIDRDRDLAVLEASEDLPIIFKLADAANVGDALYIAGCPCGTAPSATLGFLTAKDPEIRSVARCQVWQVSASFFFGNSGGPIFDADSERIVAVLVAGIGQDNNINGNLVPGVALAIPFFEIRNLLDKNFKLVDEDFNQDLQAIPPPLPLPPKLPAPVAPTKPSPLLPQPKALPKAEVIPVPPAAPAPAPAPVVPKIPDPVQK